MGCDRWFMYDFYRAEDFTAYHENRIKLRMHRHYRISKVVTNKDYSLYNTIEEVETIKDDEPELKKTDAKKLQIELKKFRNEIQGIIRIYDY